MKLLRSSVVAWVARSLAVMLVVAGVAVGTRTLRKSCENLGGLSEFRFGWVMWVPCVPGYVVNAGEPVLYMGVTPQGRPLEWDSIRRLFHDRDWREVFDARGCPLRGSGPGLTQRNLDVRGEVLRVSEGESEGCTEPRAHTSSA